MSSQQALSTLVTLSEDALISNSVQLDLFFDERRRLGLAKGFIFSYRENQKPNASELSAVEVLRYVKDGLSPQPRSNVLSLVSTYGSGKSHLALTIATFLGRPENSDEVAAVLNTLGRIGPALRAEFEAFKELSPKPHLIIPVTLSDHADLRQSLRRSIARSLMAHNISHLASEGFQGGYKWLDSTLKTRQVEVQNWLAQRAPGLSVTHLQRKLEDFDSDALALVIDLSRYFNDGLPIDFGHQENVGQTLNEIIERHCGRGADRPFSGVLVVLDEFSAYLEHWVKDRSRAGGMAIQELTDACSKHPGQLFLLTLNQYGFPEFEKRASAEDGPTLAKLTQRLEPSVHIISSLEQVLARIIQQSEQSSALVDGNERSISAAARVVYDALPRYQALKISFGEYFNSVAKGCFPLHPATSSLICHLADTAGFVQGRSLITFVQTVLKRHLALPASLSDGRLNLLNSVNVFDYLEDHFRHLAGRIGNLYQDYSSALNNIGGTTAPEAEQQILKGLFLGEIANLNRPEKHEVLIASLCGMETNSTLELLHCLVQRAVIKFDSSQTPSSFTFYRSSGGRADEEVAKSAQKYSTFDISAILSDTSSAQVLVDELRELTAALYATKFQRKTFSSSSSWRADIVFKDCSFKAPAILRSSLPGLHEAKAIVGILFWDNRDALEKFLEQLPRESDAQVNSRVLYAVPARPVMGARILGAKLLAVKDVRAREKGKLGEEVFDDLSARLLNEYQSILINACNDMRFYYVDPNRAVVEGSSPEDALCGLFGSYYTEVPPTNSDDKLASHTKGAGTQQLPGLVPYILADDLAEGLKGKNQAFFSVVNNALIEEKVSMELVRRDQYRLRDKPGNCAVSKAWSIINEHVPTGAQVSPSVLWEKLSRAPFGYDYNTFLLLFCCWLGANREDLTFSIKRETYGYEQFATQLTLQKKVQAMLTWLFKDVKVARSSRGAHLKQLRDLCNGLSSARDLTTLEQACERLRQSLTSISNQPDRPSDEQLKPVDFQLQHSEKSLRIFQEFRSKLGDTESHAIEARGIDHLIGGLSRIVRLEAELRSKWSGKNPPEHLAESATDLAYESLRRLLKTAEAALRLPRQAITEEVVREFESACGDEQSGLTRNSGIRAELDNVKSKSYEKLSEWNAYRDNENIVTAIEANGNRLVQQPYSRLQELLKASEDYLGLLKPPCDQEHLQRAQAVVERLRARIAELRNWLASMDATPQDLASARDGKDACLVRKSLFLGSELEEPLARTLDSLSTRIRQLEDDEDQRLKERVQRERRDQNVAKLRACKNKISASLPIATRVKAAVEAQELGRELDELDTIDVLVQSVIEDIESAAVDSTQNDEASSERGGTLLQQAIGALDGVDHQPWTQVLAKARNSLAQLSRARKQREAERQRLAEKQKNLTWVVSQLNQMQQGNPSRAISLYEQITSRCHDFELKNEHDKATEILVGKLREVITTASALLETRELEIARNSARTVVAVADLTRNLSPGDEVLGALCLNVLDVGRKASAHVEALGLYTALMRQAALVRHPEELKELLDKSADLPEALSKDLKERIAAVEREHLQKIRDLITKCANLADFGQISDLLRSSEVLARWCALFPDEEAALAESVRTIRGLENGYSAFKVKSEKKLVDVEEKLALGRDLLLQLAGHPELHGKVTESIQVLTSLFDQLRTQQAKQAKEQLTKLAQEVSRAVKVRERATLLQLRTQLAGVSAPPTDELSERLEALVVRVDNELADQVVLAIVDQYTSLPPEQKKRCLELMTTMVEH